MIPNIADIMKDELLFGRRNTPSHSYVAVSRAQ